MAKIAPRSTLLVPRESQSLQTELVQHGQQAHLAKPSYDGAAHRRHASSVPVLLFDNMLIAFPTELLTVSEVAEILKISETGVRRLQYGRRLPFLKIGGSVRFVRQDVAAYLDKQRVKAIDQ